MSTEAPTVEVDIATPSAEDRARQRAEAEIRAEVNPLITQANEIVVETDEQAEAAAGFLAKCKGALKNIENQRTHLKEPVLEQGRRIDKMAKDAAAPLNEAVDTVKAKVIEYNTEQERQAQAEEAERQKKLEEEQAAERKRLEEETAAAKKKEEEAAEEARKAQEAADAAAAQGDPEAASKQREAERKKREEEDAALEASIAAETRPVEITQAPVAQPAKTIRSASGGAVTQRKKLEITIVDASRVPREYLVVDEKLIRAAHKEGVTEIAGVHLEMVPDLSVRAA